LFPYDSEIGVVMAHSCALPLEQRKLHRKLLPCCIQPLHYALHIQPINSKDNHGQADSTCASSSVSNDRDSVGDEDTHFDSFVGHLVITAVMNEQV
jgi:hypothetical protein